MVRLVLPSERYKKSFLEAVGESGAKKLFARFRERPEGESFSDYLIRIRSYSKGVALKAGLVPETKYWLVEGDEYIGRLSIRHRLNRKLQGKGGHIGYDVRPSKRRRGYGILILKLGLKKAKELGFSRVLVTCLSNNIASQKIIKANGGVFKSEVCTKKGDPTTYRYWVDIK
jgi:predicted acetyltransferase